VRCSDGEGGTELEEDGNDIGIGRIAESMGGRGDGDGKGSIHGAGGGGGGRGRGDARAYPVNK
jgi:hypothetical protein